MSTNRISREELFLGLASLNSRRSTCARTSVGAVLVFGNRVIGCGYNGAPTGLPECDRTGCLLGEDGRCKRAIHAEVNAIISSARHGIPDGSMLFTTHSPCADCIKIAVAAGIKLIVYLEHKESPDVDKLIKEVKSTIDICKYSSEEITTEQFMQRLYPTRDSSTRLSNR